MKNRITDLLKKTIDEHYKLDRDGNSWLLDDGPELNKPIKIRCLKESSFAFTLDKNPRPLVFFASSPPKYVARMCDAFLVYQHEGKYCFFVIEVKTSRKDGHEKQIRNGKFFCDWLMQLYRHHGYIDTEPVFISALIWFPRLSPPRQGTAHRKRIDVRKNTGNTAQSPFDYTCEIRNPAAIPLLDVLQQIA